MKIIMQSHLTRDIAVIIAKRVSAIEVSPPTLYEQCRGTASPVRQV
jgi:hypothetical protein